MIITFLGTGTSQGVPVIGCECEVCRSIDYRDNRLRSSVLIETNDKTIVIDTGPDFRQQMLRERVRQLDAVVYTHQHKDHTAGMDDVRGFNFIQKTEIPIYARQDVLNQLQQEFEYVFSSSKYPGVPQIKVNEIKNQPFDIGEVTLTPVEVMHHKLSVFGYRVHNFTYITDANFISDQEIEKIKGSEVVVLNALRKTTHISHFSLEEAIEMSKKLEAEKTYLTHISHGLGKHRDVSKELPDNVELAYDGLKLTLS